MTTNIEYMSKLKLIKNNKLFLITPSPEHKYINDYIKLLKDNSIQLVIKATNNNLYDTKIYNDNNIDLIELDFDDGAIPNNNIILRMIDIGSKYNSICFHCMAGLGRAPFLATLILIFELNYKSDDAIHEIKKIIPKAFNSIQLNFLLNLKKKHYLKKENKCNIL
jgi:protein-tyrosine phosphatase